MSKWGKWICRFLTIIFYSRWGPLCSVLDVNTTIPEDYSLRPDFKKFQMYFDHFLSSAQRFTQDLHWLQGNSALLSSPCTKVPFPNWLHLHLKEFCRAQVLQIVYWSESWYSSSGPGLKEHRALCRAVNNSLLQKKWWTPATNSCTLILEWFGACGGYDGRCCFE